MKRQLKNFSSLEGMFSPSKKELKTLDVASLSSYASSWDDAAADLPVKEENKPAVVGNTAPALAAPEPEEEEWSLPNLPDATPFEELPNPIDEVQSNNTSIAYTDPGFEEVVNPAADVQSVATSIPYSNSAFSVVRDPKDDVQSCYDSEASIGPFEALQHPRDGVISDTASIQYSGPAFSVVGHPADDVCSLASDLPSVPDLTPAVCPLAAPDNPGAAEEAPGPDAVAEEARRRQEQMRADEEMARRLYGEELSAAGAVPRLPKGPAETDLQTGGRRGDAFWCDIRNWHLGDFEGLQIGRGKGRRKARRPSEDELRSRQCAKCRLRDGSCRCSNGHCRMCCEDPACTAPRHNLLRRRAKSRRQTRPVAHPAARALAPIAERYRESAERGERRHRQMLEERKLREPSPDRTTARKAFRRSWQAVPLQSPYSDRHNTDVWTTVDPASLGTPLEDGEQTIPIEDPDLRVRDAEGAWVPASAIDWDDGKVRFSGAVCGTAWTGDVRYKKKLYKDATLDPSASAIVILASEGLKTALLTAAAVAAQRRRMELEQEQEEDEWEAEMEREETAEIELDVRDRAAKIHGTGDAELSEDFRRPSYYAPRKDYHTRIRNKWEDWARSKAKRRHGRVRI